MARSTLQTRVESDAILVADPRLRSVPPTVVRFMRTLRIPDDGTEWPLPPGLGRFPLRTVASLGDGAPEAMRERGGLVLPMHQAEAMWISFEAPRWRPMAVKVGTGMVNAVDASALDAKFLPDRADYLVTPPQPWLDGFKTGEGTISQFVAMSLGEGVTVEEQLTDGVHVGGLQLLVAGPRPGRFPTKPPRLEPRHAFRCCAMSVAESAPMGLAAGGTMTQNVYPDPHGAGAWDAERSARIWVHLVPAVLWHALTGEPAPSTPVSREAYDRYRLPWFAIYDEPLGDVPVAKVWAGVKTVHVLTDNEPAGSVIGANSW